MVELSTHRHLKKIIIIYFFPRWVGTANLFYSLLNANPLNSWSVSWARSSHGPPHRHPQTWQLTVIQWRSKRIWGQTTARWAAPMGEGYCYTDEKENKIFLIYKEIQKRAVAKSYMTNDLLIYDSILAHSLIRGVLGNKCAGQHNLKTVHFRETLASGNFSACLSGICVFFCSPLSTLGRRRQAFM